MSASAIETPYAIASLPKPVDSENGRTYLAPIHSIRGSRKRKRHEVAVGVDGDGVNIYNVQEQRQVASYAISPQSSLCHAPVSVYIPGTSSLPSERKTYIILKDKKAKSKQRLVCFTERTGRQHGVVGENSGPERHECFLEDGEIVGLDTAPSRPGQQPHAVVSYASGNISCFSSDLQKSNTLRQPALDQQAGERVEFTTTIDPVVAKKGLLKGRSDVVASLDEVASGSILLCSILCLRRELHLRLFSIRPPSALQSQNPAMQIIMSYTLPELKDKKNGDAQYELHVASGKLSRLLSGQLSIYDLSSISPKLATVIGDKSSPLLGFAPVSTSLTMAVSQNALALYENKYGSLFAFTPISTSAAAAINGKKRKRKDESEDQLPTFAQLCSISNTGPVVALRGSELMLVQLSDSLQGRKRARAQDIMLAENVMRNSVHESPSNKLSEKKQRKYNEWTAAVDRLIETDDIESLEKLVATDPALGRQREEDGIANESHPNGLVNGAESVYQDMWPLPETFAPSELDRRRVSYILGKLFGLGESGLYIRVPSLKLLEWLAIAGYLSVQELRSAWRCTREHDFITSSNRIQPGDIMAAIRSFDDDFQIMHALLSHSMPQGIEEVVQALKFVVQSFDEPTTANGETLALPAPTQPQLTNGDTLLTNGDADSQLDLESKAAEQELDEAMSALSNGLEVRSEILRMAFARLLAFNQRRITATLRSRLSHRELLIFVHILRIELADGGWTSRYIGGLSANEEFDEQMGMVNTMGGMEDSGPRDEAIKTIGDLLNCAVDAMGNTGWLVGLSGAPVSAGELLASLRAEVCAGLEGCYEAETLGSALSEIERFARQLQDGAGSLEAGGTGVEDALLPIGGRVLPLVVDEKGRSAKKSRVALAQEKSRRVGRYSFERIRV